MTLSGKLLELNDVLVERHDLNQHPYKSLKDHYIKQIYKNIFGTKTSKSSSQKVFIKYPSYNIIPKPNLPAITQKKSKSNKRKRSFNVLPKFKLDEKNKNLPSLINATELEESFQKMDIRSPKPDPAFFSFPVKNFNHIKHQKHKHKRITTDIIFY